LERKKEGEGGEGGEVKGKRETLRKRKRRKKNKKRKKKYNGFGSDRVHFSPLFDANWGGGGGGLHNMTKQNTTSKQGAVRVVII